MENTTNKKHLFIDKKVRAIKNSNKASYLINIDDICRKDEMEVDVPTEPIILKLILVIMAIAGGITLVIDMLRQIL